MMDDEPDSASVALIHKGKVLLIQRAYPPYQHLWTLPGGRRVPGESIEDCAAREVHEELGLNVSALQHVMTQSLNASTRTWRLAVFATQGFEGEITASDEIEAHCWIEPREITGLRTTARLDDVLAKAFALFE
jgi:8-oxo-dGTP diphosphatase